MRVLKLYLLAAMFIGACNSPFVPRPTGYFNISFPEKKYVKFQQAGYPYEFELPDYATVVKDTTFFENQPENPWWINIDFPGLAAASM